MPSKSKSKPPRRTSGIGSFQRKIIRAIGRITKKAPYATRSELFQSMFGIPETRERRSGGKRPSSGQRATVSKAMAALATRGLVISIGYKAYVLTEAGHIRARELLDGNLGRTKDDV